MEVQVVDRQRLEEFILEASDMYFAFLDCLSSDRNEKIRMFEGWRVKARKLWGNHGLPPRVENHLQESLDFLKHRTWSFHE